MREMPKTVYLTPDEIEARIKEREAQALGLPLGQTRRELQAEIARLHVYADMKRLLTISRA